MAVTGEEEMGKKTTEGEKQKQTRTQPHSLMESKLSGQGARRIHHQLNLL